MKNAIKKKSSYNLHNDIVNWKDPRTQCAFVDRLATHLGIRQDDDWYNVRISQVIKHGGRDVLAEHGGFFRKCLETVYPTKTWHPWIFNQAPRGYWDHSKNRKKFLNWLFLRLKFERIEDWYRVRPTHFVENGGLLLLERYNSISHCIVENYPEHTWHAWRFDIVEDGYWNYWEHQRACFDWVAEDCDIRETWDWYSLDKSQILEKLGEEVRELYEGRLSEAMRHVYPDSEWHPWIFDQTCWKDFSHHVKYFEWLEDQLGILSHLEWAHVRLHDVGKRCGSGLLRYYYNNSILAALQAVFPLKEWHPWIFDTNFFLSVTNQRVFVDWIAEQANICNIEDWYTMKYEDIDSLCTFVKEHHGGSLYKALSTVYAHTHWCPWLFERLPQGFWENTQHHEDFLEFLALANNILWWHQFYKLQRSQFLLNGGQGLLKVYDNSHIKAVMAVYPCYQWNMWQFEELPSHVWDSIETQRSYFDWVYSKLGLKDMEEWHLVSLSTVQNMWGRELLDIYGNSLSRALTTVYSTNTWKPWISCSSKELWDDFTVHRKYLDWLGEILDIKNVNDWYTMKREQFTEWGTLLDHHYDGSYVKALEKIYPHTTWQPWRFVHSNTKCASKEENMHHYLVWVEDELSIDSPSCWYGVTPYQITNFFFGRPFIQAAGSLLGLLKIKYPQYSWNAAEWKTTVYLKTQQLLAKIVKNLLPVDVEVVVNYSTPFMRYEITKRVAQVDVWVPQYNLAFEYQGGQHYMPSNFFLSNGFESLVLRDAHKVSACEEAVVWLVKVPYWWDMNGQSLAPGIHQCLPKLIPSESSHGFGNTVLHKPKVSKKVFRYMYDDCFEPPSSIPFTASTDISGWWFSISEDGVRLFSDGCGNFFSLDGKPVAVPAWARKAVGGMPLELRFLGVSSKCNCELQPSAIEVVDAPTATGELHERLSFAERILGFHPLVQFTKYSKVSDTHQFLQWLQGQSGEKLQVLVKENNIVYRQGKSPSFQYLKVVEMEEATVTGFNEQKNILQVKLTNGLQVNARPAVSPFLQKNYYGIGTKTKVVYYKSSMPSYVYLLQ